MIRKLYNKIWDKLQTVSLWYVGAFDLFVIIGIVYHHLYIR